MRRELLGRAVRFDESRRERLLPPVRRKPTRAEGGLEVRVLLAHQHRLVRGLCRSEHLLEELGRGAAVVRPSSLPRCPAAAAALPPAALQPGALAAAAPAQPLPRLGASSRPKAAPGPRLAGEEIALVVTHYHPCS